ncbi:MAG TPA: hypothetical protein VHE35_05855 [Kofleriaceae bacterium]|nr:hypothetical protein [Kofleriaceae bacterium]
MRTRALVLAVGIASAGCNAHWTTGASKPAPAASTPGPPKSASTGVALAVVGSIVPAIGFGAGLTIDDLDTRSKVVAVSLAAGVYLPSLGYIYARRKTSPGMYPRIASLLALGLGALLDGLDDDHDANTWYGISGGLYAVGCGIDIVTTPHAVAAYNAEQQAKAGVAIVPTALPGGAGLALGGRF